jgi:hypothetical protein
MSRFALLDSIAGALSLRKNPPPELTIAKKAVRSERLQRFHQERRQRRFDAAVALAKQIKTEKPETETVKS